ncbi:MAG: HAD-IA family hydrolase [Sporolactobacillus sp.]
MLRVIKAIVFDFDGVILDSERMMYLAMQEMFHNYHVDLPFSVWSEAISGRGGDFDAAGYVQEQSGVSIDRISFLAEQERRFQQLMDHEDVLPGVKSLIDQAERRGLKIGLAASSPAEWVYHHLKRLSLSKYFLSIQTKNDVKRVKPDPSLYLQTLKNLGVAPNEAIAFEDSVNGVVAAKRAGLFCIAVPSAVTKQLPFGYADGCFNSLKDIALEKLINYLAPPLHLVQ